MKTKIDSQSNNIKKEENEILETITDVNDTAKQEPENKVNDEENLKAEQSQEEDKIIEPEKSETEILQDKFAEMSDKYVRLSAEFDNYRKRTLKEKMDLIKGAGEEILKELLPVMDNFDRAMKSLEDAKEIEAMKEGIHLIHNNFSDFLKRKGIKEIEAVGKKFDADLHEAITKIPAPEKKLKGKIVDCIEKGYYLNDKIIRYSKVVIGE